MGDKTVEEERVKQAKLEGFTPKKIAELNEAADGLRAVREKRQSLQEKESEAEEVLLAVMKRHKLLVYPIDDEYEAIRERKEKGFVRKIKNGKRRSIEEKDAEKVAASEKEDK